MVSDGAGVSTIENAFGVLRQVMGAALEDNRIARNPCDGVKLPKRKHADRGYLSHAQVAVLADAVERNGTVVKFLAYTEPAVGRNGRTAGVRFRYAAPPCQRVPIGHRIRWSGLVGTQDTRAPVCALPGSTGR